MYLKIGKPLIDKLSAFLLVIPLAIGLLLPISMLILISDGRPIFYKGTRIGQDKRLFSMYKFRTMKNQSKLLLNEDGSTFNAKNDARVTRIGRLLRETSLDELPQVLNILKGEMSFIGPRASLASALPTYQADEMAKMDVKPGITGLTQAYYRNKLTTREKRLKDAWYSNHVTFCLDAKIFFRTIVTVLKRENIYSKQPNKLEDKK